MDANSPERIATVIEGVVALCMGDTERLVWVPRTDAAVFNDGERIYLPVPTGSHDGEHALLLALALREVAKLRACDTAALAEQHGDLHHIATVLEEARLKKVLAADYRGAPDIFDQGNRVALDLLVPTLDASEAMTAGVLAAWAAGQDALLGTPASAEAVRRTLEVARRHYDDPATWTLRVIAMHAPDAGSTQDVVELASRIHDILQRAAQDGEPNHECSAEQGDAIDGDNEPHSGAPEVADAGCEEASDDAATAPSSVAGEGDPEQAPSASAAENPQGAAVTDEGHEGEPLDDQAAAAAAQGGEPEVTDATTGPCDPLNHALARLRGHERAVDVSAEAAAFRDQALRLEPPREADALQAVQAALDELQPMERLCSAHARATLDAAPDDALGALLEVPAPAGGAGLADGSATPAADLRLQGVQARLVNVLMRDLQDQRRRPSRQAHSGQVLAHNAWRLACLGDTRIFRQRAMVPGISAAVSILLDTSDSMCLDGRLPVAVEATYALALAFRRIAGVQVAVHAFPGRTSAAAQVMDFRENVRAAEPKFRRLAACGGTPTGSALALALPPLLARNVQKRMVLVITDGQPDPAELPLLASTVAVAQRSGVEVVGIGIAAPVAHLFRHGFEIGDAGQLAAKFEELFRSEFAIRLAA